MENLIICLNIKVFAEIVTGNKITVTTPAPKSKSEKDPRFIPGEILFEAKKDSSNVPEEYKICPDKTKPKALLVPIAITS